MGRDRARAGLHLRLFLRLITARISRSRSGRARGGSVTALAHRASGSSWGTLTFARSPEHPLRDYLDEHKLATGRGADDLAFGRTATDPFVPSTIRNRALAAWQAAGLEPVTLHESRHTFASLLIAAGENPKAIQEFMGHASIQMTLDRYGHPMPGSRDQARARMTRSSKP